MNEDIKVLKETVCEDHGVNSLEDLSDKDLLYEIDDLEGSIDNLELWNMGQDEIDIVQAVLDELREIAERRVIKISLEKECVDQVDF